MKMKPIIRQRISCNWLLFGGDSVIRRKRNIRGPPASRFTRSTLPKKFKHVEAAAKEGGKVGNKLQNSSLTPKFQAGMSQKDVCTSGDVLFRKWCQLTVNLKRRYVQRPLAVQSPPIQSCNPNPNPNSSPFPSFLFISVFFLVQFQLVFHFKLI